MSRNRLSLILLGIIFMSFHVANALIPVSYACCKNFITSQGELLDGFEDLNNWTFNGLNDSNIIADKINFKEGKQGLKLVAKNGDKTIATRNIRKNFRKTKNFVFDLYVYDSNSSALTIYFSSDKNWSKYFYYKVSTKIKGWNKFVIPKSDMHNRGGEDWNDTMIMFRIVLNPQTGKNANLTIDNFRYDFSGRAKVIFAFDDGKITELKAEQILTANNQNATSFVIINHIINNDKYSHRYYMNLDDIKKLQSFGWDISSHTISHPHLAALDNDNLTKELNNSYEWLFTHGFQKTAGFLAYPYGSFNEMVIEKTKQRYIIARTVEDGIEPHVSLDYGDSIYKLKTMSVYNTTSVQSIKDRINSTIGQGSLIILSFHDIVDNNPTLYEYSKLDLQQISNYINSRSKDIDVVTFSDYLNANIRSYTPVINKTVRIYSDGTVELLTNNKYDENMPNMTVKPSLGSIDVSINKYEDQLILFNETVYNLPTEIKYSIGDRIPNQNYSVKTYLNNGVMIQDIYTKANGTGYINYFSKGFDKLNYTEITPYFSNNENIYYKQFFVEILISIAILIISVMYYIKNYLVSK